MTLSKKVGPLPIWAWGAAIAAGILIYYFRHNSSGAIVAGATNDPLSLGDPTQGAFPMPDGISSGGATPELSMGLTGADVQDAVSQGLLPLLTMLPYASTPGEPSNGGADGVQSTVDTINALRSAGLIAPLPASSTGSATSKAQTHEKAKGPAVKVNTKTGSPRAGKTYKVVVNPAGHPHGTYHVYGKGKTAKFIRVKK